jgi:phage terminase large subunit-like protein
MLRWITDYIKSVENRPQDFNQDVKDNVRQIKELLSRKTIFYKEADPIAFEKFAKLFKHREGMWAGKPLELNKEQKYIVACLLGIKTHDKKTGRYIRYFNEMDLFVARKWGKDHFIVPLIAWFTGMEKEPSAWCQIVAENTKQSRRTYDIVANAIKQPPLSEIFKERTVDKHEKLIECTINHGRIEYLSGRTKGKDSSNPSVGVVNEAHEITNYNQYLAIKTGVGAREQPMIIVISSAGVIPESLYEMLLERNRKFLRKPKLGASDRIFALMYGIDDTDDYRDESCWIKANPAMYEGRPTMKFLREQYEATKDNPILLNSFIAKQLNRQVGAAIDFFDMVAIKNSMREIKKEEFYDSYAVGGVDLAETTDLCNATAQILTRKGKFLYLQAYFIAQDVLERNSRKDKQDYQSMTNLNAENEITSCLVIVTPGSYVQKEYVTQWFVKLRDEYKITFLKIGYDRALSKEWLTDMQENGFSHEKIIRDTVDETTTRDYGILTEVAQGGWTLSEPIKIIKSLFENGKLIFDKSNKLMPYCFYNLRVRQDSNNNLSPHKAKSTGHIDGCIGVFNAFVAYQRAKELDDYKTALADLFAI